MISAGNGELCNYWQDYDEGGRWCCCILFKCFGGVLVVVDI